MAHQVEMINGVAQMAYAGALPWHGLGEAVSNDLTPHQMMEKAGLNWEVNKIPMNFTNSGGKLQTIPEKAALVRSSDSKVLDIVGEGWNPIQNTTAFNFFYEYVLAGDMEMHTAGSLKGGKHIWALAKVKESFDVFGEDTIESFVLFSNPHQYGKSADVRFTPIRVVCNNTLSMSLGQSADRSVRIGHATPFNPDSVKETLGIASEKFAKYKEMAEFLGSKRVSAESLLNFYNTVYPHSAKPVVNPTEEKQLSRPAKLCYDALNTQPGAHFAEGSWWQAFNSVTYVTDHVQGNSAENRLHSQWFGGNQARKLKAAEVAVKMATAA